MTTTLAPVVWKQTHTTPAQWVSTDKRRVQYSDASKRFLVFKLGEGYLGWELTLEQAKLRLTPSDTKLQDEVNGMPAFVMLSQEERNHAREGNMAKRKLATVSSEQAEAEADAVLTGAVADKDIVKASAKFNKLAMEAQELGMLHYKPVQRFETLALAEASITQIESSLKAKRVSDATVNQEAKSSQKGVAKSAGTGKRKGSGAEPPAQEAVTQNPAQPASSEESNMTTKAKTAKKATKTASKGKASTKKASKGKAKTATKANGGERAPRVTEDAAIALVKKENPFREGTSRYTQLELVKKGTVAKFKAAGGNVSYLSWFKRNGLAK